MIKIGKLILVTITFIILTFIVNSTDYSGVCPEAGSPVNTGGTHYLTGNISGTGHCFYIQASNIVFDCQGYTIDGDNSGLDNGFYIIWNSSFVASKNITIKNCIIKEFLNTGVYLSTGGAVNITIINSTMKNNLYGVYNWANPVNFIVINSTLSDNQWGAYLRGTDNYFYNVNIVNNTVYGIRFRNSANNYMDNVLITNSPTGIEIGGSTSNTFFNNSNISGNINYNFYSSSGYNYADSIFMNSYLGNWSKIDYPDWTLVTNTSFYDNTYLAGTQIYTCFDYPVNNTCEGPFPVSNPISTQTSSNIFPLNSVYSTIIAMLMILFFL